MKTIAIRQMNYSVMFCGFKKRRVPLKKLASKSIQLLKLKQNFQIWKMSVYGFLKTNVEMRLKRKKKLQTYQNLNLFTNKKVKMKHK